MNEMKWNEMKWNEMKWNEMKWNEMKESFYNPPIWSNVHRGGEYSIIRKPVTQSGTKVKNLLKEGSRCIIRYTLISLQEPNHYEQ